MAHSWLQAYLLEPQLQKNKQQQYVYMNGIFKQKTTSYRDIFHTRTEH